jgi:ribosome biogenesis GTPase / thiamine phosphate phosphatase
MKTEKYPSSLKALGWNSFFNDQFHNLKRDNLVPVRVISQQKYSYKVAGENGELEARLSGKMLHDQNGEEQRPVVGDWVLVNPVSTGNIVIIEAALLRKSKFSRQAAGGRGRRSGGNPVEQVIAANIDTVFIVSALDRGRGLNFRRLERYLTLTWESGASPVIILNKTDLCENVPEVIREVEEIAQGVPILSVSATEKKGIDLVRRHIVPGTTAAFLGPSGVGKSTLINALLGSERIRVQEVREDDSAGRHTTTSRELFRLPDGGMVIDTPGIREIQLWTDEDALGNTFSDVESLAGGCRFRDCSHQSEPGCAVQQAIQEGTLDSSRLDSYFKLQKEIRYLAARQEVGFRLAEKERWKKISQYQKDYKKGR